MSRKERMPSEEELGSLASILAKRFVQRWDQYPKQLDDGAYVTVHKPLTETHLIEHLRGEITLGTYLLDPNSKGRFLVYDADDEPDWRRIVALSQVLKEMGSKSYLERSRRGGHLWLFFDDELPGEEMRTFGKGLLGYFGIQGLEMFPKQDRLTTGPGSLVRMPFGVHRKVSRRYGFYSPDGERLAPTLREQIHILGQPGMINQELFEQFYDYGVDMQDWERLDIPDPWDAPSGVNVEGETLSDQIKSAIPVRQFVLQYVELSKSGRGLCPFHDDHVESFSVNDEENYWNCFAGCGGGSVIDFWMKWKDCDFTSALSELANLLSLQ